jgi:hypothetical protein
MNAGWSSRIICEVTVAATGITEAGGIDIVGVGIVVANAFDVAASVVITTGIEGAVACGGSVFTAVIVIEVLVSAGWCVTLLWDLVGLCQPRSTSGHNLSRVADHRSQPFSHNGPVS